MPTVKRWADDLRAAFGADEIQAALKSQGYYASEGGRTVDTRVVKFSEGIPVSQLVVGPQAGTLQKGGRGR